MRIRNILNRIKSKTSDEEKGGLYLEGADKPHSIEVLKHSKNYSKLLNIYVESSHANSEMKKWFKILFFAITMGSMLAIVYFFWLSLNYAFNSFNKFENLNEISMEAILGVATIVFPAISSLIVAFIKIPQIIAQYLFNVEEDSYMNSIIKNIQDYDKAMFAYEHRIDEMLMQYKERDPKTEDDSIGESPVEQAG